MNCMVLESQGKCGIVVKSVSLQYVIAYGDTVHIEQFHLYKLSNVTICVSILLQYMGHDERKPVGVSGRASLYRD